MLRSAIVLIASALLMTASGPRIASAQAGWKTEVVGKDVVLTPPDLSAGEFYQITVHPRAPMGGALITDFVDGVADRETAVLGTPSGKPKPARANDHTFALTDRAFLTAQGAARAAIYNAVAADGENARVIRIVSTLDASLLNRYQAQALAVLKEMRRQEEAAALAAGRGLKKEELPRTPQGMTPGGRLVPGIYAGNGVRSDNGEVASRFRLYLYASGECQVCNEKGEEYRFGRETYTYDPITGKLDVSQSFDIYNSVLGPADAFSLYGRDADGKPYLYARSDHGFEFINTTLHYLGPPDRPSPKQQEAAKAAAEAEAKRYKYVLAPGKGVQTAQVAGIFHNYRFRYNLAPTDESYLLLKDGTVHDGLPVPPDELDVSLSRRREPEKWGHWRRQGTTVLAAWADQPNHFVPLQGSMAAPATPGERLSGRFGTGETSGNAVTPQGRFLKDNRGGTSSSSLGATMNGFDAETTYDDEGSSTVITSPAVVGGVTHKKTGGHRAGTYSVSGYTLTLRYDDGRVARLPFFFETPKRDQIYFEGATLGLDDGK